MTKPQVTVLENGLTVITQKRDTLQPFIQLTVGAGSRHETPETAGISHNLEHILAGDTIYMSSKEQAQKTGNMRGITNANTGFEETNYFYRVGQEFLGDAMQLIADGIQKPLMSDDNINKEKGPIISEIQMRASDPDTSNYFQLLNVAYAGGNIGRDITGSPDNIAAFTPQDLQNYMKENYTSDNMTLIVAGNVDHDEICKMAAEKFSELPRKQSDHDYSAKHQPYRGGYAARESVEKEDIDFHLAFEAPGSKDYRGTLKTQILSNILGGGFDARLLEEVRTKRGLAYGAHASGQSFDHSSLFVVSSGFDSKNAKEAVEVICDVLSGSIGTITQEELDTTRNRLIGSLERLETTDAIAQRTLRQHNTAGQFFSIEETIEQMRSITLDELHDFAKQVFSTAPSVAAYGKGVDKIPSYEEISERMGKRRELDESGLVKENAPSADRAVAGAEVTAAPAKSQKRAVA